MHVHDVLKWALCSALALPLAGRADNAVDRHADGPAAFQLGDVRKLIDLSEPQISPDGRQVAVIVSTPDWKTDKAQVELDLVDVASGARRAITWKRSGIASPRWSPDGTRLAFLAEDATPKGDADASSDDAGVDSGSGGKHHAWHDGDTDGDDKQTQLFILSLRGGDPVRVTEAPRGVDAFAWSPSGAQIAYVTADEAPNAKAIKAHDDAFEVTDNHFLTRAALTPWHLWLVPAAGGPARRLTKGAFSLQTDQQDSAPTPAWSPDGTHIAFTRFPGPYWGPSYRSVVDTVAPQADAGGPPQPWVTAEGAQSGTYAQRGDAFAFLRPRGGDQNNGNAVYVMAQGQVRDATQALARNINGYAWMPKGDVLLLEGEDGTRAAFWLQPLQGAARKLDLGDVEASADLSVSQQGAIAFIGRTPRHPDELYVIDNPIDRPGAAPRALTQLNHFVDQLALGRTEAIDWQGPDHFHEDGVLTYPVGFEPGRRYPLVLSIHGGPEGASTVGFDALSQLLSAAGFLVFQPNYRGSTNLGDAYQHAIFRDTGTGPDNDVMAGLAAVQQRGIVDAARIGVSGWSYGGYLTAWLTGHHDIWRAAVAGAALTDWVMDYTIAYYQQGDNYFFGGSPWVDGTRDIWRAQSPIAYASHVTAPTLILGDVGDPNVPLVNSYEWYHALRDHGVEVKFFAYPTDTHFPGDIVRTTDVYRRWVGWMTQHLK
jgi:dipeptidyl aminopeptidase/acylaminoacyl peptidase